MEFIKYKQKGEKGINEEGKAVTLVQLYNQINLYEIQHLGKQENVIAQLKYEIMVGLGIIEESKEEIKDEQKEPDPEPEPEEPKGDVLDDEFQNKDL